jgi:hypothetical protein
MAGGTNITTGQAAALAEGAALALVSVSIGASSLDQALNNVGITLPTLGPYRDKQQNKPATYSISIPQTYNQQNAKTDNVVGSMVVDNNGVATVQGAGVAEHSNEPSFFVFDAVFVANHSKRWIPTRKPLQSGYNFSDHAIKEQPFVVLEIGMSDAMAAYKPGMWTGSPSKSISCWQQLNEIADQRRLFTLATRQETYTNMMIVGIESSETNATIKSMKARITFQQMLLVNVSSQTISARPNATDSTQLGTQQSQDVSTPIVQQHEILPSDLPTGNSSSVLNQYNVPAGGQFSSNLLQH